MSKSTFSGPIQSLAGFISAGNANVVSLTADTTLTVAAHAGKIITTNDADGKFTLPTIDASTPSRDDEPDQTNNLGATFTDKFVGGLYTGVDDSTGKTFISGASNDVITMNGSTKGGLAGSIVKVTAIADNKYAVEGLILGSGTIVTPFADA
jgi:hypothetical protein